MKKQYFIYILLCAYSCFAFAGESTLQREQADYNNPEMVKSSIDDGKETEAVAEAPKKPGILDSWSKVVTLKWRTLSRDDAWNIAETAGMVALGGVGYYMYSSFKNGGQPGPGGPGGQQPPHNPFGGNPGFGGIQPNNNQPPHDPFGGNPNGPFGGNNMPPVFQGPQQLNQPQVGRNQVLRQMHDQLRQQQELLRRMQQQEDDEYAEAVRQSLRESEINKNAVGTMPVQEEPIQEIVVNSVQEKDCDICFETKNVSEYTVMPCCQYSSCTACLMDHLSSHFDENSTENLVCPNRECNRKIEQPVMKVITGRKNIAIYNRYTEVALKEFFAKATDLKQCPTPDCPNKFEPAQNRQIYTCDACNQKYCSHCLVHHDVRATTCEQAKAERERQANPDLANQANQEWIAANTKACPSCKVRVEKNGGCLWMKCGQCHHAFCWRCLNPHDHSMRHPCGVWE